MIYLDCLIFSIRTTIFHRYRNIRIYSTIRIVDNKGVYHYYLSSRYLYTGIWTS